MHAPGAMHPVEGIQCGLPLLYHADSGGTVALGEKFGVLLGDDVAQSMREMRDAYVGRRRKLLIAPPSGDRMCLEYRRIVQREICMARDV